MKINTSTIEGYEAMTAEQKIAALEALDIPDPDYSGHVKKSLFDQTASELAEMKKKYNATLSAEEQAKLMHESEMESIKSELATLKKEKTVSEHKAKLLALGYEEVLAAETATALADGDMEKVFANQKKFLTAHDTKTRDELLKGTARPPAGEGSHGVDYQKKIDEARAVGDLAGAAYYTRLKAESQTK